MGIHVRRETAWTGEPLVAHRALVHLGFLRMSGLVSVVVEVVCRELGVGGWGGALGFEMGFLACRTAHLLESCMVECGTSPFVAEVASGLAILDGGGVCARGIGGRGG